MQPGNHAKRIRSSQNANPTLSFFAKKRDTLLSLVGGFLVSETWQKRYVLRLVLRDAKG